jgi:hypothetical protein
VTGRPIVVSVALSTLRFTGAKRPPCSSVLLLPIADGGDQVVPLWPGCLTRRIARPGLANAIAGVHGPREAGVARNFLRHHASGLESATRGRVGEVSEKRPRLLRGGSSPGCRPSIR